MIRNLMVCGVVMIVALGCGSDDDEATDAAPTTEAESGTAEESGDLEAWCLGWNADAPPPPDDDFQAWSEAGLERTKALSDVAPDEIAAANATMLEAQQVLNDYLAEQDWDPDAPRLDPDLAETPMMVAIQEMEAFASQNC